jgi:UDP-3-O-[3-hydroxymyristoyl] glucosamine N-acyltransferase
VIGGTSKVGARVKFMGNNTIGAAKDNGCPVIEDDVVLAGQVGVANHVRLGKGVVATAQTGIPNSVDPGEYVSGYPAIPHRAWLKSSAVYRQLPALRQRVATLEQRLAELEEKLAECQTRPDR